MNRKNRPVVVVADPNHTTRALLSDVFEAELDAYIVALETGESLMQVVHELVPTLIVFEIDRRRPMDLEVLRQLAGDERAAHTPVLCLTAWAPSFGCAATLENGCADCLEKPFDLDELVGRAAALMRRAHDADAGG